MGMETPVFSLGDHLLETHLFPEHNCVHRDLLNCTKATENAHFSLAGKYQNTLNLQVTIATELFSSMLGFPLTLTG